MTEDHPDGVPSGEDLAPLPAQEAPESERPDELPATAAPNEPAPADPATRPPRPEDYVIRPPHGLIEPDPDLNARLLAAGFSQAQAQLVYDLAAERLLPMMQDMLGEVEAHRQLDRLERHFGGADAWRQTARQIRSWAKAHLADEVYAALSTSCEGVLALHQMMRAGEPELLGTGEPPDQEPSEDLLAEMVRDPRYWRERDPEFVARVTAGFKRLYAG